MSHSVRSSAVAVLHAVRRGIGPRLVLAHGFTQSGRIWGQFGDRLSAHHELICPDLPGHGGSSGIAVGLWEAAALLVEVGGGDPVDVVGYSMGGRVALHAALNWPERIARLVLISTTAGIEDVAVREARRMRDAALASELESSGDVAAFIDRWLKNPMFDDVRGTKAERLANTPEGLASSLRLTGAGSQDPLWDRLAELPMPVLVMAGANDPRFVASGSRIANGVRHGVLALVPGAGHAAPLVRPRLSALLVESFLSDVID
jgi:2-succinyl-6-hydroxy-2,4-cyclohexadiene-1-carboxylate synthase